MGWLRQLDTHLPSDALAADGAARIAAPSREGPP